MKSLVAMLSVACLLTASASAQPLPDRRAEISALIQGKYTGQLNGDDAQGSKVLDRVCADLNLLDQGQWGRLIKNDRNPPFVPYDILVWKPTREHVDVLTGFGAVWIPHGVIPDAWAWLPCPLPASVPPPNASPPTGVPVLPADLQAEILATLQAHEASEAAERVAAAQFRDEIRSVWRDRFVFIGKYVMPVVGALFAGRATK